MTPRAFIAVIGVALIAGAIIFGFVPASAHSSVNSSSAACGSPFSPDDHPLSIPDFTSRNVWDATQGCSDALGSRRLISFIGIGVGLLAVIGCAVIREREPQVVYVPSEKKDVS